MATKKKLLQAAAGQAGGAALNVEEVFSTYLYEGQSAFSVVNGIDMATHGGAVWIKNRSNARDHRLFSTGLTNLGYHLTPNLTSAEANLSTQGITSFNSNGWSVGTGNSETNASGWGNYASWTFRKAPKFFDVVTYTGTGSAQSISHNLGSVPGMIITKRTDGTGNWVVYHRGADATAPEDKYAYLESTAAFQDAPMWNDTAPTDTEFSVGVYSNNNASGGSYVAYLFAHNNGDGEFGPTGDQDIIKCGSFTTTGDVSVDLGFEPQWLLVKRTDSTEDWKIFDSMRGFVSGAEDRVLLANSSNAENDDNFGQIESTGFQSEEGTGKDYIYIAIRRGPMAVPESATDVFDVSIGSSNGNVITTGFPVDTQILNFTLGDTNNSTVIDRLRGFSSTSTESGKRLVTSSTAAETSVAVSEKWTNTGFTEVSSYGSTYACYWNWRRAPNYFDVVTYKGNGLDTGHNISHNLGAVPEMIWVKNRETASQDWYVYHKDIGNTHYLRLNSTSASLDSADAWNDTTPTDSVFTVGGAGDVNWNNVNHIAYLFASLDGVSKVGSYTGNGGTQNIDCGFSSGARFVLIKGADYATNWYVFDTERGIVAGNDAEMYLDSTAAEATTRDLIDPYSAGFTMTGNGVTNTSGYTYIFYAIA